MSNEGFFLIEFNIYMSLSMLLLCVHRFRIHLNRSRSCMSYCCGQQTPDAGGKGKSSPTCRSVKMVIILIMLLQFYFSSFSSNRRHVSIKHLEAKFLSRQ